MIEGMRRRFFWKSSGHFTAVSFYPYSLVSIDRKDRSNRNYISETNRVNLITVFVSVIDLTRLLLTSVIENNFLLVLEIVSNEQSRFP